MSLLRALRPLSYYNETIEPDDLYYILSNQRRRMVLKYLLDHDSAQQTTIRTLAEHLEKNGIKRNPAYVSLYQTHLPALDNVNLVEYNKDRGYIKITRRGITAIIAHQQLSPILTEDN